jgi:23S rRNA (cytidine1920-2'-O)/16S rRNA (cytidine1409-2'-O)-methyltransferase
MRQACADQGLTLRDYFESPITGGDGNREFFVWACQ